MREAIGGTWLFGLVITFIVFFASFLAISINYSQAFNVKNNVVDTISKYEGNNIKAREEIYKYLKSTGYMVLGSCPERDNNNKCAYNGYNLNGDLVMNPESNKAYYWIREEKYTGDVVVDKTFYKVVVFFRLDLPLVNEIFTFKIKGETEAIYFAKNS